MGERSFSKLGLIKDALRVTMLHKRLNALSRLSIESNLLDQINIDIVI